MTYSIGPAVPRAAVRPPDPPAPDGAAPRDARVVPADFPLAEPTGPALDARPRSGPLDDAFRAPATTAAPDRARPPAAEPTPYEPRGAERFEGVTDLKALDVMLTEDPSALRLFQTNRDRALAPIEAAIPNDVSTLEPAELSAVLAKVRERASETASAIARIPDDSVMFRQGLMGEVNARMNDFVEGELSQNPAFPGGAANWQVLARDFGLAWNVANEDIAEYASSWDDIRDPSHPFGSRRGNEIESLSFFLPVSPLDRPLPDGVREALSALFPEQDASEIDVYVTDDPAHTARGQNFDSVPVLNTGNVRAALGDPSPERVRWEEDRIIANELAHAAFDRAYPDFGEREYDFPAFGELAEVTPSMVYELASDAVSTRVSRTPIVDTFGSTEPNYALSREVVRSALLDFGFSTEELERLEGLPTQRSRANALLLLARERGNVDELRDTVRAGLLEQAEVYLALPD